MTAWLDMLDETIEACATGNRPDLVDRLRLRRARLLDQQLRVLVVGEPNQGKSQLINALVNAPVCAVGDAVTTTAPTVVHHAEQPSAVRVMVASRPTPTRQAIPVDQVTEQATGKTGRGLVAVEIGIPRKLLASGLVLIDTPAIGESNVLSPDQADIVLLVSDATRELSTAELELLVEVARSGQQAVVALTKIDMVPRWREVAERDRGWLARAGVPAKVIPVSAVLRIQAVKTDDPSINAESGFPHLIECFRAEAAAKSGAGASRQVAVLASTAVTQLVATVRDAMTAPAPGQSAHTVARLNDSQRKIDELQRHSVRWQTLLSDEVADLVSDVEHDLRERTRKILREVDKTFDEADPAVVWETFEQWLAENLADAADLNFGWLVERFRWTAVKVAKTFPVYREDISPESILDFPDDLVEHMDEVERPKMERFTVGQKVFTALRGSYGGMLMFGLMTSFAGMPLVNAISLGAGAAFGGKSIHDEAEARLKRRQLSAKSAAQRYVDDFFLRFSKDSKDTVRHVHRRLRDHFTALTEDMRGSLVEAAREAREAAQQEAVRRERHSQESRRELERLVTMHQRAQALAATNSALPTQTGREITA